MGNKHPQSCIFCNILLENNPNQILAEDQQFFAFHDIDKASAKQHVLVCTKQHIKNALELPQREQMQRMRVFGEGVLNKISNGSNNQQYRFGFHLPPYNSVDHVHLHCFVLPFTNWWSGNFKYSYMLNSIEETEKKWQKKHAR